MGSHAGCSIIPPGISCGMFHNPTRDPIWKRRDPTWDTHGIPGGIGGIPPYIFTSVLAKPFLCLTNRNIPSGIDHIHVPDKRSWVFNCYKRSLLRWARQLYLLNCGHSATTKAIQTWRLSNVPLPKCYSSALTWNWQINGPRIQSNIIRKKNQIGGVVYSE